MKTSPAITSARNIALAGGDFRPYLNTCDPAERLVEVAVHEAVGDRRVLDAEIERKNLAGEIVNGVGRHVAAAIQNIAQAMRPR